MESCIFCVEKHLAKAHVYYGEARSGYAGRFAMMLGEMAAAEEESIDEYPIIASMIRMARKSLEKTRKHSEVSWEMMLQKVEAEANKADPGTRKMPEEPVKVAKIPTPQKGSAVFNPASRISATPCKSCKERAEERARKLAESTAAAAAQTPAPAPAAPLLIILTAISGWASSYSLASVILDQAKAAAAAGFRVQVVGMHGMDRSLLPQVEGVEWVGLIPDCIWKDDKVDEVDVLRIREALEEYLKSRTPSVVLTHDWMLISSYVSLAKAIHEIGGGIEGVRWYHQIHSSLGARPTSGDSVWRSTIPEGHQLVIINHSDKPLARDYYQIPDDRIHVLPNTRDIRVLVGMTDRVKSILDQFPLHLAQAAQVYPLSTPRAFAKGLDRVIKTMAEMKRQGATVRLLVVNPHANGPGPQKIKASLDAMAKEEGLTGEDFAWTSDLVPASAVVGLDPAEVFSLLQLANVFCFPSTSEAAGLVMMEAALAGNLLVLNSSLPVLQEYITHQNALWVRWGSIREAITNPDYKDAAIRILTAVGTSLPNQAKRRMLASYGQEALAAHLTDLFWPEVERSI